MKNEINESPLPLREGDRGRGRDQGRDFVSITSIVLLALMLSACGTKGDLECPRGTMPHIDGTCASPVK